MGFPLYRGKQAGEPLFSPDASLEYRRKTGKLTHFKPPEGLILSYSSDFSEYVLKNHKTTEVAGFRGKLHLLNETGNTIGMAGDFGFGAPAAVVVFELYIALGIKRFVSIGTAGGLQRDVEIGDLVVCEKAIRDEGTSHHYLPPSKYAFATPNMVEQIKKSLDRLGEKYVVGTSWTLDAPYRETVEEIKHYQKEGVATAEMEASALFSVAAFRKVEIGAMFAISDLLYESEWMPHFYHDKTMKGLAVLYNAAIEALKQ
ncbi:nucleoside phosphorylase [Candidatus Micrarchaeota archaeon]|nr:nucleoside phosphorylase [Candidatus Micrarchaeota archaeon]